MCEQLPKITNLRAPRWFGTGFHSKMQLHGFADATSYAYGITFFLRQGDENTQDTTNLIFARSRVAPVKGSTIPKLELSACHLLAELLKKVREAHDIDVSDCILWSDSMIALHWIGKSPES